MTLRIREDVIVRAKKYARSQRTSLSKMIEAYFESITKQSETANDKQTITPLVESLIGVMDLPAEYDHKKDYREYIINKYK